MKDVTAQLRIRRGMLRLVRGTGRYRQRLTLHNLGAALSGRLTLVLDGLSPTIRLRRPRGFLRTRTALGSPQRTLDLNGPGFAPGTRLTVVLEFLNPRRRRLRFVPRVFQETT